MMRQHWHDNGIRCSVDASGFIYRMRATGAAFRGKRFTEVVAADVRWRAVCCCCWFFFAFCLLIWLRSSSDSVVVVICLETCEALPYRRSVSPRPFDIGGERIVGWYHSSNVACLARTVDEHSYGTHQRYLYLYKWIWMANGVLRNLDFSH